MQKISFKNTLFIGSLLFGLLFGAGNLIFPVNMGQLAGGNSLLASFGFILTGVGIPFLGVLAIGLSGVEDVFQLAKKVGKPYAYFFTVALYFCIGPLFAVPRLASTSYTIGLSPYLPEKFQSAGLFAFSLIFFLIAWYFSKNSKNLLNIIGKVLNPAFLALLFFLLIICMVFPMGDGSGTQPVGEYLKQPFLEGVKNGYNTLDALAALAFSILIIQTIKSFGLTTKKEITSQVMKSGIVVVLIMSIVYITLTFAGLFSLGKFEQSENGGIALSQIANYQLSSFGGILLALIITFACLKTAIGLISAFGETAEELFPSISKKYASITCVAIAFLLANVGLTQIITLAVPVLMFIYPLAITLILLSLLENLIGYHREIYVWVTSFTMIISIIDALKSSGETIQNLPFLRSLLDLGDIIPFASLGFGWILPSIIGFVIGFIHSKLKSSQAINDLNK
ncbi:MAG: branched-chain amino acid transport system II carrier protein [Streptococcaceae bacterium]|jgi:LIVCS family branched-chain amino acid:cation transporter|nr:branched-chain amino acid transport system II carrier protein [Streptococcaceae bacterium]